MRRKLISLVNLSSVFRYLGLTIGALGLLHIVATIVLTILVKAFSYRMAVSWLIVFPILGLNTNLVFFVGMIFWYVALTAAFLTISEVIMLLVRMEVDLKQLRFSGATATAAVPADASGVQTATTAPTSAAPAVEASKPAATESKPTVATTPAVAEPKKQEEVKAAKPAVETKAAAAESKEAVDDGPASAMAAAIEAAMKSEEAAKPDKEGDAAFDFLSEDKPEAKPAEKPKPAAKEVSTADSDPELSAASGTDKSKPEADTRPISYCPSCNATIRYKPEKKGKVIMCPKCHQPFRLGV